MRILILLLFSLGLCGCTSIYSTMPGSIWIGGQPQFAYEAQSDVDFSNFKYFTVFSQSKLNEELKLDPLVEKLLLFIIRNQFEVLGYRYVDNAQEADFFISTYYFNEYRDGITKSTKLEIPEDTPEKTGQLLTANYESIASLKSLNYFQDAKDNWGLPLKVEEPKELKEEKKAEEEEKVEEVEEAKKTKEPEEMNQMMLASGYRRPTSEF